MSLVLHGLPGCFRECQVRACGLAVRTQVFSRCGATTQNQSCVVVGPELRLSYHLPEERIPFLDGSIPTALALRAPTIQGLGMADVTEDVLPASALRGGRAARRQER